MRFNEFKIILESAKKVYVVGDSIAVGIKNAGNAQGIAAGGKDANVVLGMVKSLISGTNLKDAIVILSSGASNSTFERPNGETKSLNMSPINAQLEALKSAGASVALVGTGSKVSQQFTNSYGTYRVNFAKEQVNQKLASAAQTYGATFLGPLEEFDPAMSTGKGDGIHPYNGYSKLFSAGSSIATSTKPSEEKSSQGAKPTAFVIDVPDGRVGPAVADIQKALIALGYPLPKHGVDGVRGSETSSAVKAFQQANGLTVDGDPGPETVGKLNAILKSKPEVVSNLTKSTASDVKGNVYGTRDIEDEDVKKLDPLPGSADSSAARNSAEQYLGRKMSDDEWNYLIRATAAESSYNKEEYAMVMGSILNRARDYGKNGVIAALTAKNQFQAVTGTAADGHQPSANFVRGPNDKQIRAMLFAAVHILPKVSHSQRNFTAANPAAYGAGTNIGYLHAMNKAGGQRIGGTVFNTALV